MDFNYLDIGLSVFIFIFGFIGYIVGFTEKIFSIITWSGSIALSFYTYGFVRPFADKIITKPSLAGIGTALGLFIIYLLLFTLLSRKLNDRVQKSSFQKADHYLGAVMGLGTAFLIISLGALILRTIIPTNQYAAWAKTSVLWSVAEKGGNILHHILPTYKVPTVEEKPAPTSGIKTAPAGSPTATVKRHVTYSKDDRRQMNTLVKEYT